ncbi:hypothetical protein [Streptomyces sp. OE57]
MRLAVGAAVAASGADQARAGRRVWAAARPAVAMAAPPRARDYRA